MVEDMDGICIKFEEESILDNCILMDVVIM